MSLVQILVEYVLVYSTAKGLAAIGEPSSSRLYRKGSFRNKSQTDNEDETSLPVWIISIFVSLAALNYILTFMAWYVFNVISTVVIVASTKISLRAAAMAKGHEDSQRVRLERLALTLKGVRAFKSAGKGLTRVRTGSVLETRQQLQKLEEEHPIGVSKLKRRPTLLDNPVPSIREAPISALWTRLTRLPCFRGFIGFLYMAVPQWYLSQVIDMLLSGQPEGLKPGYGTTSIVLTTVFGGGFAVWTHYCITKPTNKDILAHFPKGREVLVELWPITAMWAVCEHLPNSISLALSRYFKLKTYAYNATMWNTLDQTKQQEKIVQFGLVLFTYVLFTVLISVPATMILRRVYASMLSDEDLAIVPFNRGNKNRAHSYDQRSKLHQPGLKVSEAWVTITFIQYLRVLMSYFQYFIISHLIHMTYWIINWKLQEFFQVEAFASTKLPNSPIAVILPFEKRNISHVEASIFHSEL